MLELSAFEAVPIDARSVLLRVSGRPSVPMTGLTGATLAAGDRTLPGLPPLESGDGRVTLSFRAPVESLEGEMALVGPAGRLDLPAPVTRDAGAEAPRVRRGAPDVTTELASLRTRLAAAEDQAQRAARRAAAEGEARSAAEQRAVAAEAAVARLETALAGAEERAARHAASERTEAEARADAGERAVAARRAADEAALRTQQALQQGDSVRREAERRAHRAEEQARAAMEAARTAGEELRGAQSRAAAQATEIEKLRAALADAERARVDLPEALPAEAEEAADLAYLLALEARSARERAADEDSAADAARVEELAERLRASWDHLRTVLAGAPAEPAATVDEEDTILLVALNLSLDGRSAEEAAEHLGSLYGQDAAKRAVSHVYGER